MIEIEKNESPARQEYEPMEIKVMTVTPQGVLCQSGGGGGGPMMTPWNSGSGSCGSI